MSTTAPITDQSQSQSRYVQLPNGSYMEWPQGVSAEEFKAKAAQVGGGDTTPPHPGLFERMENNFNAGTQGAKPGDGLLKGAVENFGAGAGDFIRSTAHALTTPSLWGGHFGPNDPRGDGGMNLGPSLIHQPMRTLGGLGAGALTFAGADAAGDAAMEGVPKIGSAIRTAAIGDPNAPALRGLQVGAKSPKTLSTIRSVEGARPYLQGAQNLQDLQTKVPAAKSEIWQPYQDAVDAIGSRQVHGPDGPTTVSELEAERAQLSALNRGLKQQNPEAIQLAQQKGMTQAQLLDREKAVIASLDPELESTGIDPKGIRKTFGNVAQVGQRVSGKSTLIENAQPSGVGRMLNMKITDPRTWIGEPAQGLRDLAAGRPLWSAKPTDLGIREGFRTAGPKPDFGSPRPNLNVLRPLGLPAPAIPLGDGDPFVSPPGRVPITQFSKPLRLPARTPSLGLPISSYNELFPDQIPNGTRVRR